LDNLEKFYADSFNSIAYKDDCQIVESFAKKRWAGEGEVPHVKLEIYPLDID
jgi:Holliday junction resolvase RusA-like endonuclease